MTTIKHKPFDAAEYLDSDEAIAEYLSACMEEGGAELFLSAINDAVKAKGMSEIARKVGVSPKCLHEGLSPGASPRFETVFRVVQAMGLHLAIAGPS